MTGPELRSIRLRLGLTQVQLARALGSKAITYRSLQVYAAKLEAKEVIPERVELKVKYELNGPRCKIIP